MSKHESKGKYMKRKKPLVFLDVDGVINDIGALKGDFKRREVCQRHKIQFDPLSWVNVYVPNYMPELIQRLVKETEVRWLTTWRHEANTWIAPILEIPELDVVDDGSGIRYTYWKAETARPQMEEALDQGREVYWIEDFGGIMPDVPEGVGCVDTGWRRAVLKKNMLDPIWEAVTVANRPWWRPAWSVPREWVVLPSGRVRRLVEHIGRA